MKISQIKEPYHNAKQWQYWQYSQITKLYNDTISSGIDVTLKDQELYANKIKLYNQKFETIREKPYFVCSPYFDMNNERSRQTLMQFSTKREQTSHRHQHFNSPTENLNKIHSC